MDALDKLHSDGLDSTHVQCLRKFAVLQGEIITDSAKLSSWAQLESFAESVIISP